MVKERSTIFLENNRPKVIISADKPFNDTGTRWKTHQKFVFRLALREMNCRRVNAQFLAVHAQ